MAAQHKYSIESSSELIGLGFSNFLGSMAGAYPVTGSFSRSAVNNDTGAQTQVSGIVTATIVLIVLGFLTSIFQRVVRWTLCFYRALPVWETYNTSISFYFSPSQCLVRL
jgi:sulfate transporter 4